jgi:fermentation-respiration switch protein FrsA (DUF1100 family)
MKTINGTQRAKSILVFAIRIFLVLSILLIGAGFVEVNHVLHPPRIVPQGRTLRKYHIPYQAVDLITDDGVRLSAWYTPPKNGAVILLAHGYGEKRPEWVYALVARKGFGVLAWDARAHGSSGGDISTVGYLEVLDVKAALKYVLAQPGLYHVGAWGGSMGAATVIQAAAAFPEIEAVFADSSFDSLDDEFNYLVPYPVINPLAKFIATTETGIPLSAVDPLDDIAKISPRPVYIVHSTGDAVAPPDAGEKLFNAAREPRFLWEEKDVPHLQMYLDNPRKYQRRLIDFFNQWLLGKS